VVQLSLAKVPQKPTATIGSGDDVSGSTTVCYNECFASNQYILDPRTVPTGRSRQKRALPISRVVMEFIYTAQLVHLFDMWYI